jgi:hypothetical protein
LCWLEASTPAPDLNTLDLRAVGAGLRPGFGAPVENLFLICTNGRHNVCCARLGTPLARALREELGDAVWETTHLGGDRYSANMVCLPDGFYYGDLAVTDGFAAATRYVRGEVWLKRYRGRAGLPQAAQAAEHFLRTRSGIGSVTAVAIESVCEVQTTDAEVTEVVASLGGERYLARVERVRLDQHDLECPENLMTYALRGLFRLRPAPASLTRTQGAGKAAAIRP